MEDPEKVLIRICKIARTLQIYKDSYNKDSIVDDVKYVSNSSDDDKNDINDYKTYLKSDAPQFKGSLKTCTSRRRNKKYDGNSVSLPTPPNPVSTFVNDSNSQDRMSLTFTQASSLKEGSVLHQGWSTQGISKVSANNGVYMIVVVNISI